jgi:hypothetical protein
MIIAAGTGMMIIRLYGTNPAKPIMTSGETGPRQDMYGCRVSTVGEMAAMCIIPVIG